MDSSDPRTPSAPSGDDVTLRADSDTPAGAESSGTRSWRGRFVGRFVMLERIGRGGMGVVYLAYDPELDRRVAVKLVAASGTSEEGSTARLVREAQALAQLAHPNVVAVHDVGRTDEGIYVAMEYVEGMTLGAWLRERSPPLREIVETFAAAARGIAAAHDVGLVHRDIKPDNIMVSPPGPHGERRVRVLDFGLARVAGPRVTPSGELQSSQLQEQLTVAGTIMGTPVYMAPEQYEGKPVDARSDVYSLCVALWEAVHGQRPFAGASLGELADNVLAGRIVEQTRSDAPAWLRALLRRGLARDPNERIASMRELVTELERDRRRRVRWLGIGASVIAALGLGASIARGLGHDAASCDGYEATLVDVWDEPARARIASAFAREGKSYAAESWRAVEQAFDTYADALVAARTEACTATRIAGAQSDETMGRRMACLDARTRHLDALVDALTTGGADTLEHAVAAADALPPIDACADLERLLREAPLPEDPALREDVAAIRSDIEAAKARATAADFDGLDEATIALVERARVTGYAPCHAEALLLRGRWLSNRGEGDSSVAASAEALALAERSGHDVVVAEASIDLLISEGRLRGHFEAADVYARHAESVIARLGDPPNLRMHLLSYRGQLENVRKRPELAVPLLDEAMTIARGLGREHDPELASIVTALTVALTDADRLSEADQLVAQNLALLERRVGTHHPSYAMALSSRARLRHAEGREEEAVALWRQTRALFIEGLGPDHSNVAAAFNGEGLSLVALGRDEEAARAFEQTLQISERTLGPEHGNVSSALLNRGRALTRAGDPTEAAALLRRSLEIRVAKHGAHSQQVAIAHDLLGDALFAAGDDEGAAGAYGRAVAIFERLGGRDEPRAAYAIAGLCRVAERRGDTAEALAQCERALALQRETVAADERGALRFALARLLASTDPARARTLVEEARGLFAAAGPRGITQAAALEAFATAPH
ncbi:MAG TPA: serine/threonine-protein kinase [Nannocystaceae bacterium]|nr:serine/threonine-protein kinase [Nannocystaceae bacterium]